MLWNNQCLWVVDFWLFCFACLRPVTRVPNVASVSEFFILYYFALFVFVQVLVSNVNCQYPWVVNLWLICFVSLRSVSCVPTVVSVSGLPLRFSITCICFVQLNHWAHKTQDEDRQNTNWQSRKHRTQNTKKMSNMAQPKIKWRREIM
jgi:hypothetical protein